MQTTPTKEKADAGQNSAEATLAKIQASYTPEEIEWLKSRQSQSEAHDESSWDGLQD